MSDFILRRTYAMRWDGTNGAAIAAMLDANTFDDSAWTVTTETSTALMLVRSNPAGLAVVVPTEPWVVVQRNASLPLKLSDAQYANQMIDMTGMKDEEWPADPAPALAVAVGTAALPALLLGGTTSPTVTFDVAMPSTAYDLKWRAVAGAAVLSTIVANGAATKATGSATIPLRATGISVAGVLLVEAYLMV